MVLIPEENEKDLADIPKAVLNKLEIHPVSTIDQVLSLALTDEPKPLPPAIEADKAVRPDSENAVVTH
jgi:ATP-dependent Lon protease